MIVPEISVVLIINDTKANAVLSSKNMNTSSTEYNIIKAVPASTENINKAVNKNFISSSISSMTFFILIFFSSKVCY